MQKKYRLISDPGHGWLEIPRSDLAILQIGHLISTHSYQKKLLCYLEEDCDLRVYMIAAKDKGWTVEFIEVHQDPTPIRNYHSFMPSLSDTPGDWEPESGQLVMLI